MICQDPDGCTNEAVVGVGYRVMWVCQVHYEQYLAMVRRVVDELVEKMSIGY